VSADRGLGFWGVRGWGDEVMRGKGEVGA